MLALQRAFRLLQATLRNQIVPRGKYSSKPALEIVTPAEQAIGLTVMFSVFLLPSGWILVHIQDYKAHHNE